MATPADNTRMEESAVVINRVRKLKWFLIEGRIQREILYGDDTYLILSAEQDLGGGLNFEQVLPVMPNGKVFEIVQLPAGIENIGWRLTMGEVVVSQTVTIRRIAWYERGWRMVNRVGRTLITTPVAKRRAIGITFIQMVIDLPGAYKAATRLRFYWPVSMYENWVEQFDILSDADRSEIQRHMRGLERKPFFLVFIVACGNKAGAAFIEATVASLDRQLYREFSICVHNETSKKKINVPHHGDDCWVMLLSPGDELSEHALYWFACEIMARPDAAIVYSDDDTLDDIGRRFKPRFKPDWSLTHLRSTNYVGSAVVMRGTEITKAGGLSPDHCWYGDYDLLLRVVDAAGGDERVAHIPAVLLHDGRAANGAALQTMDRDMDALRAHLARNGVAGEVRGTLPGCWHVHYRLPQVPPLVSIIVPTRDRLELIQRCLESVLEKTSYPSYEILVVDNQSAELEVLAFLDQMNKHEKVRVIRYDLPFNFSAMNNMAVREAGGEVICLLNNDTEVISPDWLEEMVGHLLKDRVGIVGAKLYYPDGRVQHGGDLVGVGGVANHAHAYLQRGEPGYCNHAILAQDMSAVTAACLVTWRYLYQDLGGLDERHLQVEFNDVDYCLRAREAGYRTVWAPHAELYHHESVSRGKDLTPEKKKRAKREAAYMRKRWKRVLGRDPFYNPNLSYERPDFSLSHAPMVKKPWKDAKW